MPRTEAQKRRAKKIYAQRKNDPVFVAQRKRARIKLKSWTRAYHKRWRSSPRGMAYRLLQDARQKAKRLGLRFNLTVEDCAVPTHCPVFGYRLRRGIGKPHRFSPTLDRLNPKRGYVKGNVAIISLYANSLKHNGTAAQHRRIADWMEGQANATKK